MDFAFRSRRRGGFAVAAVIGVAAVLGPASALAAHNVIEPISVPPDGAIGNDSSVAGDHLGDYGDMTPDGRFVVFASAASNLVPGDTNGVGDVFVRDRRPGVTERVSLGRKGVEGNGDSNFLGISTAAAISDDGRYVAFKSDASNLVRGDRNGLTDVFVRDRAADITERISGDGGGDNPGISPDGNFVAFETFDFDGDSAQDIYLRDRATGTIERISVSHDGSEIFSPSEDPVVANAPDGRPAGESDTSRNPAITPDGRFVAFQSNAQNFTPVAQTRLFSDVFVRDREAGTTVLASPNGGGGDAFVRDLTSQSTEMISVNGAHQDATRDGFHDDVGAGPVSADGLVTLMGTQADNLFAGDNNSVNDVYVSDRRPAADLSLEKADAPDPVAPRDPLTYTLVATNNGPNAAPDARLLDTLPAGATATITITVTPKAPGVITNTASVGSSAPDPDRSSNKATTETTVVR